MEAGGLKPPADIQTFARVAQLTEHLVIATEHLPIRMQAGVSPADIQTFVRVAQMTEQLSHCRKTQV